MVRIKGFEMVADILGHAGEFYTLTTPSRMHACLNNGRNNPRFDGTTTLQAHEYLTHLWALIRSELNRQGIRPYGFRVVEPHHDGTPHWHLLLFMPHEHREIVREVMRQYALAENGNEPGAQTHRFKAVAIDPAKGTAAGYIAKYIAKNIDGHNLTQDLYGNDAVEASERITAWANIWGIRQFQQIGGPSVTVWRQLRRLEKSDDDGLEYLRSKATSSNWAAFMLAMGDYEMPRSAHPIKPLYGFNRQLNLKTGEIILKTQDGYGGDASKLVVITFAFVRDNIYRAISKLDPDFTRNIEGQTLRLHWDEYNLFNLVCFRIKSAFKCENENSVRIWNQYAAKELKWREGFRLALKLTLYRPRDILVLLNEAFLKANSNDREQIILEDIEYTAKTISMNRLNDLHKEYEYIFPSIEEFTKLFYGRESEITVKDVRPLIDIVLSQDRFERNKQQDIFLFNDSRQVLQRLYSVGFIGIHNEQAASFVFCHDGKDPDREFSSETRILVHPCYWLALGIGRSGINLEEAEEIHDEYEIEVTSESEAIRNKRIEILIQELNEIKEGPDGAHDFEGWCVKAIKIIFAGTHM